MRAHLGPGRDPRSIFQNFFTSYYFRGFRDQLAGLTSGTSSSGSSTSSASDQSDSERYSTSDDSQSSFLTPDLLHIIEEMSKSQTHAEVGLLPSHLLVANTVNFLFIVYTAYRLHTASTLWAQNRPIYRVILRPLCRCCIKAHKVV